MTPPIPLEIYKNLFNQKSHPLWIIKKNKEDYSIVDLNLTAEKLLGEISHNQTNCNVSEYFEKENPIIDLLNDCYRSEKKLVRQIKIEELEKRETFHFCANYINEKYAILEVIDDFLLISQTTRGDSFEDYPYSTDFFRNLIDQSLMGIAILQDNKFVYVNERFSEIIGYSREELLNLKEEGFLNLVHLDYINFVKEQAKKKQLGLNNQTISYDFKVIHKSGKPIWIRNFSKTIYYKSRKADFISLIDITEMKKAQSQLEESEKMFRLIANQSALSIAIIQDNEFKYMNPQFGKALGYNQEEIKKWSPRDFIKFVHPEDRQKVLRQLEKKQKGHREFLSNYDFRVFINVGEVIWINVFSKSIMYNGKPADLAALVDVTEKKNAKEKLKKSRKKYKNAFEKANFYKELLVHDVNNILQSLKTASELAILNLKMDAETQDIEDSLKTVNEQVNRGAVLVKNIQRLSEIEEQTFGKRKIDICSQLEKSINFVENSYPNRNIDIKVTSDYKHIRVKANELIQDVFENLLINAVKHNENEQISINIKITKVSENNTSWVKMQFIDNAKGIKDNNKDLIFQGIDIRKRSEKGMGFGLTLVKKIIDSYNGKIWVENRVPEDYTQGSKVILLFPLPR